jgi:membrane-associated phospholipid phosphatase
MPPHSALPYAFALSKVRTPWPRRGGARGAQPSGGWTVVYAVGMLWRLSPALVAGTLFLLLTRFVRRVAVPTASELRVDRALEVRAPPVLVSLSHAVDAQRWIFVVLACAVGLALLRRPRQGLVLLLAVLTGEILTVMLKLAINRIPPGSATAGLPLLQAELFPSGHVVRVGITLGLLILFVAWPVPLLRLPAVLCGGAFLALMGWTQAAVGGHLPLDVLGGYLVAAVLVNGFYLLGRPTSRRSTPPPDRPPRRVARLA